jgi:hypothetical protein
LSYLNDTYCSTNQWLPNVCPRILSAKVQFEIGDALPHHRTPVQLKDRMIYLLRLMPRAVNPVLRLIRDHFKNNVHALWPMTPRPIIIDRYSETYLRNLRRSCSSHAQWLTDQNQPQHLGNALSSCELRTASAWLGITGLF